MLNYNGIAWMIAGGVREATRDDQRQLLHRLALADSSPSPVGVLRRRIAGIIGARTEAPSTLAAMSTDCCAA